MVPAIDNGFPEIERVDIDPAAMACYTHEAEFTALAFGLLREVVSYTCVAACTMGPAATWNRDQAAVGGNMVRLYKLLSALLDQTAQNRGETSAILGRLAFETAVNVRYLMANFSPELVDSYIRFSLRHERRLQDLIHANVAARGGDVKPIETRMLSSLDRSARIAGLALGSIDLKDRAPWGGKNAQQKAEEVGLEMTTWASLAVCRITCMEIVPHGVV